MALLFSSVPYDNITATIVQAFSQVKRRKWRPDVTFLGDFGWFSAFFRKCVIHHCIITVNKHFHRENRSLFALIQTFKNVLRIFIHRLTFFVLVLNVTSNICSLVINHGDKTVSKLYRK